MNAEQLQKTLHASQYAEQVLANHESLLQQDYAIDQFLKPLSADYIHQLVISTLQDIQDETLWMKTLRILRARLNVPLDLARFQPNHRCGELDAGTFRLC